MSSSWDEFLPSKIRTLGVVGRSWCKIHHDTPLASIFFWKNISWEFSIFELCVCRLYRPNFDLSGRISADRSYFQKIYPYNFFPLKMSELIRISCFCSSIFSIFAHFLKNSTFTKVAKSSSGGVLTDLKVLPSKSSHSQLHFSYILFVCISHQSKDIG